MPVFDAGVAAVPQFESASCPPGVLVSKPVTRSVGAHQHRHVALFVGLPLLGDLGQGLCQNDDYVGGGVDGRGRDQTPRQPQLAGGAQFHIGRIEISAAMALQPLSKHGITAAEIASRLARHEDRSARESA